MGPSGLDPVGRSGYRRSRGGADALHSLGTDVERKTLIYAGVLCWSAAALDAIYHLANGDLVVPLGMASAGIGYVAVRRAIGRLRHVQVVTVDTRS